MNSSKRWFTDDDINELMTSDLQTNGRPVLPAGSRPRLETSLEQALVNWEDLCRYVRQLQQSLERNFRHHDPLPDRCVEAVLVQGLRALDDETLASLTLNPVALFDLYDEIDERMPESWLAAMERDGRALLQEHRRTMPPIEHLTGQTPPVRPVSSETVPALTPTFRTDPARALEIMRPIVPLLLDRVLSETPAPVSRFEDAKGFLDLLALPQTLDRLRAAKHVRDEIVDLLASYCEIRRLAKAADVRAVLSRSVMDNILWQAVVLLEQDRVGQEERESLGAVRQALEEQLRSKEGPEPAEDTVAFTLGDCAPQKAPDLKKRLQMVFDTLIS